MVILKEPIDYFIEKLQKNEYFSLVGYSDAEWYCILGKRVGSKTGLGQVIDEEHGKLLLEVLCYRQYTENFLFAVPCCLRSLPEFQRDEINQCLGDHKVSIIAYERDIITDDLAKDAELYPLIDQLQKMSVVIIGNKYLRGLNFLQYNHFTEISSPNLHKEPGGIDKAVQDAIDYGQPGVYLVSAGVSAAIIIDQLHNKIQDSWFIDCGSIWDAFVEVGRQREWRKYLYNNPEKYEEWVNANLHNTKFSGYES